METTLGEKEEGKENGQKAGRRAKKSCRPSSGPVAFEARGCARAGRHT